MIFLTQSFRNNRTLQAFRRGSSVALVVCLIAFLGTEAIAQLKPEDKTPEGDIVVLRALDKVTARTEDLYVPIDETVMFGSLAIRPRKCLKRPPEETPETSTFLEITEIHNGEEGPRLFNGWMFASSPAINALEHPVYDVWVIDCRISEPVNPSGSE